MRRALILAALLAAARPAGAGQGLSDEDKQWMGRVNYTQVGAATQRLKGFLDGRVNFRQGDSLTPEQWREILTGLGPDEVRLLARRYPGQAAAIEAVGGGLPGGPAPGGPDSPPQPGTPLRPGGRTGAARPPAAGALDSSGSTGGAAATEKDSKGGAALDAVAGNPASGPSQANQLEQGAADAAAAKAKDIVGGREALWGADRQDGDLPSGAGSSGGGPARPGTAGGGSRAAAPQAGPAAGSDDPEDPRARALAAISRYRSEGGEALRVGWRTGSVPAPSARAAEAPVRRSGPYAGPSPSGLSASEPGPGLPGFVSGQTTRAKAAGKKESPYGELSTDEEKELDDFLKMIDEVAATGVLDSGSANKKLASAEAKAAEGSALDKALSDVRAVLERSGRRLGMKDQALVLAAAKRLGFSFNARQAWNLLRALEKSVPPEPRVIKELSLWERIVRWIKRIFVRLFGR